MARERLNARVGVVCAACAVAATVGCEAVGPGDGGGAPRAGGSSAAGRFESGSVAGGGVAMYPDGTAQSLDSMPQRRPGDPIQVVFSRGAPTDSDDNGFADTFPVVAYLFPDPRYSELPVWCDGTFEFTLSADVADAEDEEEADADKGVIPPHHSTVLARWVFPPEMVEASRRRLTPGPAHSFFLRLGPDQDALPRIGADLTVRFTPSGGGVPVMGRTGASVMLGGRRR